MSARSVSGPSKEGRIISIDAVRGLAILMMLFSHGLHWFFSGTSHDIATIFQTNSIGDMATPLFYTISGVALYLSATSKKKSQIRAMKLHGLYAQKFAQLFLIGFILSKTWGVLQAQAVSLFAVVSLFLLLRSRFTFKTTVSLVPLAGVVSLVGHSFVASGLSPDHLLAQFFRGDFPVLAIMGINAFGFYLGYHLRNRGVGAWTTMWGMILISGGLLLHHVQPIERIDMSFSFIAFGMGTLLLLLFTFELPFCRMSRALSLLIAAGKDALFVFVAHYLVFFVPLYVLGLISSFDQLPALALSVILTVTMIRLAYWRKEVGVTVYGALGWLLSDQSTLPMLEKKLARLHISCYQSSPMDQHLW